MDIEGHTWVDHDTVGLPTEHIVALELYRDSVVAPSLASLDRRISELQARENETDVFLLDDYGSLFQATVEGYLLAVQSMWERGLRAMLIKRASRRPAGDSHPRAIKKAYWKTLRTDDLHAHFERLMGVPLQAFDSYADLDLLQLLGSALRHGDGPSAQEVHRRSPSLWFNWAPPGTLMEFGMFRIEIPADAPSHPSISKATLSSTLLEQMIHSVIWFWCDIEFVRLNSLGRQDAGVREELARYRAERAQRVDSRVWTPG